jgi:O-antigen/teichoic acid export membrane protein
MLNKQVDRTTRYFSQVKKSFIYRLVAVGVVFITTPLLVNHLGYEVYGIWSTLFTIVSWIIFFDLGVGNSLRNKVAGALLKGNHAEARDFISSAYVVISLWVALIIVIAIPISLIISWQEVFNTKLVEEAELRMSMQAGTLLFLLNFWIGLVAPLLGATHKSEMIGFGQFIANLIWLMSLFVCIKLQIDSLFWLIVFYGISLLLSNILLTLKFFKLYPSLIPDLKKGKLYLKSMLSGGFEFFIIQIAALVIFSTDRLIIIQLLGPSQVTVYDIMFKLFSIVTFAHSILSAPLWSSYTEAYKLRDKAWLKEMFIKQLKIFLFIILVTILLALFSPFIIDIWIGKDFEVTYPLIVSMAIMTILIMWSNIFAIFINGVGRLRVQTYTAIVAMVTNIPLSIFFVTYFNLGVSGVVLATIISLLISAVLLPMQVFAIVNELVD